MTAPSSIKSAILEGLKTVLEASCLPYQDTSKNGSILWNHYTDIHSPDQNPLGAIWMGRVNFDNNAVISRTDETLEISMRLLVSESDDEALRFSLLDWQELLIRVIFQSVKTNGITGTYRNIALTKSLIGWTLISNQIIPYVNQDSGGTGAIDFVYSWKMNLLYNC